MDPNGVETAKSLREISPATRVLLMAGLSDARLVTAAIGAGCSGFLAKTQSVRDLVSALRVAHLGDAYLSPDILGSVLPKLEREYRGVGCDLTTREREILKLMAAGGLSNKDLAIELHLSTYTVRNHVQNILLKLGAHSKLEAVVIAAREAMLDMPPDNV